MFDPMTSDLAGVPDATLRAWLLQAQTALHELSTGGKVASASYSQGEGGKSVTFTQAQLPALRAHIAALKAQLGMVTRPRRALRFAY